MSPSLIDFRPDSKLEARPSSGNGCVVAGAERVQEHVLLLDLVFVSDPHLLSVVRAAIERLTEVYGFSPPECRSITRAVDEALANVIRHAYENRPGQRIEVSCKRISELVEGRQREALEIQMLDWGVPLDPRKLTARSLDEVKPGGLGLHFIRDSMDVVERRQVNGGNQLRLVKYHNGKVKDQRPQGA